MTDAEAISELRPRIKRLWEAVPEMRPEGLEWDDTIACFALARWSKGDSSFPVSDITATALIGWQMEGWLATNESFDTCRCSDDLWTLGDHLGGFVIGPTRLHTIVEACEQIEKNLGSFTGA